jgi:hypothetical protein
MSDDDEYEYDYSDDEEYEFENEDDEMDWNPSSTAGIASENPNAAPTMSGKCHILS